MEWDGLRCQAIHVVLSKEDSDENATSALSMLLSLSRSLGQPLEINNRDKKGNTPLHYGSKYAQPPPNECLPLSTLNSLSLSSGTTTQL
jgi:hypothetical protein